MQSAVDSPVFLLGAGFNRDARAQIGAIKGHSFYGGAYEIDCDYPLVSDLAQLCFDRPLNEGESIEVMFATALRERDFEPLRRLYDSLMKAEYYIAPKLLSDRGGETNPYAMFFDRFENSHILTFNYDSLPEILLFLKKRWYPEDGYGIPVIAQRSGLNHSEHRSTNYVLHLHGSLCVYARDFEIGHRSPDGTDWLVLKDKPNYVFDPHSIAHLFSPYERVPPQPENYEPIETRVIAPVPEKAEGLQRKFMQTVHLRSEELLESCPQLVVIGYRFNPLDRMSYDGLLRPRSRSAQARALLISPDADLLKQRLDVDYPKIHWAAKSATFAEWAYANFPGIG